MYNKIIIIMEKKDQATELLKSRLSELELYTKQKKYEIEQQYQISINQTLKLKAEGYSDLESFENEKNNIANALKALGIDVGKPENSAIPITYNHSLPFVKKALYALFLIKVGDFEAVKAKLQELESGISQKSLNDLNQTLSGLYNKGLIKAERNGRRYIYSIY